MMHNHYVDKNRRTEKLPLKSIAAIQIHHHHHLDVAQVKPIKLSEGFELSSLGLQVMQRS